MHNGSKQNPSQWVTNQDGSIRFDVKPLIDFLTADEVPIRDGSLRLGMKEAADNFAIMLASDAGLLPLTKGIGCQILEAMFLIRDLTESLQLNEK